MLKQNLIITYSNQKARQLKQNLSNPLDKVITLDGFINEIYERESFAKIIDKSIALLQIHKTISDKKIDYFDFIKEGSDTLDLIYEYILKVDASTIELKELLSGEKYKAIKAIADAYEAFKQTHSLVDENDLVRLAIDKFEKYDFSLYENQYLDKFELDGIKFYNSNLKLSLIQKLQNATSPLREQSKTTDARLFTLLKQPFDINEEVCSSLKLARKLLQEDDTLKCEDICIVTTDINEYAPIFRLYLSKYGLQGFDSKGKPLNLFDPKSEHLSAKNAYEQINKKIENLKKAAMRYGLTFDKERLKKRLVDKTYLIEEKIGIELTEANQLVGLGKTYKHIIFIGADINHFPPKRSDNFLYSSKIGQDYFCENSYYESSQLQYEELKKSASNLYVIHPEYQGKRRLTSSIIVDKNIQNKIDISDIKESRNKIEDEYIDSIKSKEFTHFDGLGVQDVAVHHLSASQLSSYAKCPLNYLYSYKLGLRTQKEESEGFDVMQQGSLMHACYEEFAKKIQGRASLSVEDMKKIMITVVDEEYQKFLNDPKNEIESENIYHKIFKQTLSKGLSDDTQDGLLIKFILFCRFYFIFIEKEIIKRKQTYIIND